MAESEDVIAYLRHNYPHPEELSAVRLMRMVYLADWKSAIERGRRLTSLCWEFGDHGPCSEEAGRLVHEEFSRVRRCRRAYPSLTPEDRVLLDFVIRGVAEKGYPKLEKLVYSTYPVFTGERYSRLRLVSCAKEYLSLGPLPTS